MKTSERHRLKTNEVAVQVAHARELVRERQRSIVAALIIVAVVVVVVAGYFGVRKRAQARAGAMLAEAMAVGNAPVVPPPPPGQSAPPPTPGSYPSEAARDQAAADKLLATAQAYPNTTAGLAARFQAASKLAELSKLVEAEQQFLELTRLDPSGLYGRMALLGLAEVQVRAGNYEQAITSYNTVVSKADPDLPLDGVLMQLARAYTMAGKGDEARKTLTRIVDEFAQSSYAAEARRQLETLGGKPS